METEDKRKEKSLVILWGGYANNSSCLPLSYFNLFRIGIEITTINLWPKRWISDERLETLTKKYGGNLEQIRQYLEPEKIE